MNKITLLALAAVSVLAVSPAMGQGMMKMKKPMMHHKMMMHMDKTSMMMMDGLTPMEKKTAMHMMGKMTMSEHAAMKKAAMKSMMNGKMGMKMSGMSDAQMHAHLMMGMSHRQKRAMMSAMKKMTPAEMAVGKKMMMNAYNMGMMKHGM